MNNLDRPIFVIVGAGLAAGKAVQGLRENGFRGRIVLFGEESHLPYERPPLSKGYLMGDDEFASTFVQPLDWYREHDVELLLATRVTGIDPSSRSVIAGEQRQRYDKLLLATGASPRHLPMADDSGAPVTYLRTIEDSDRIKQVLKPVGRVAIVGGGWIGLEVASAARNAGSQVTVLERLELPLLPVLGPQVARFFAALHHENGVDIRVNVEVSAITSDGGRGRVTLTDGSSVEADLVVVGIGVMPNMGLADAAGLETGNGIVVDQHLRTSDSDIFAAGDVANAYHRLLGRKMRTEHWDNAQAQGLIAARNMLGESAPFDQLPYFFTDQFEMGVEYVGSIGPDGYDQVVLRGLPEERTFTAFWLRDGWVLAGMHANDWDAIEPIRKIVGTSPARDALCDSAVPLDQIAEGQA